MAKLDIFEYDINKLLRRLKKKHIRPIMCPPHPNLNGIPVMVNSKGEHSLPVAPENGLPPLDGIASDSFGAGDGLAFAGSLGDAGGGSVSMGESINKGLTEELNINSPEELLAWMDDNITYELANDEYGVENDPPTKTAEEVLATGKGHCAEQSYLEKKVLDSLGYNTQLIFVKENNSKDDYGADGNAHIFLVYLDGDRKYVWFEHAMEHARGIHKFNSLDELLKDVAAKWWRYDENSDILEVRFLDNPITGVNNWELAQSCNKYPVRKVLDISDNVLEKDVPLQFDPSYNAEHYKELISTYASKTGMAESINKGLTNDLVKYIISSLLIPHAEEYEDLLKDAIKETYGIVISARDNNTITESKETTKPKTVIDFLKSGEFFESGRIDGDRFLKMLASFINKIADEQNELTKNSKEMFLADLCYAYGTARLGYNQISNAFNREFNEKDKVVGFYDIFIRLFNNYKKSNTDKSFLTYFLSAVVNSSKYYGDRSYEGKRQLYSATLAELKARGNYNPTDEEIINTSSEILCTDSNKELIAAMEKALKDLNVSDVDTEELKKLIDNFYEYGTINYKGENLYLKDFKNYYKSIHNNKPLDRKDLRIVRDFNLFDNSMSISAELNDQNSEDKQVTVEDRLADPKQDVYAQFEEDTDVMDDFADAIKASFKEGDEIEKGMVLDYLGYDEKGKKTLALNELEIARKNDMTVTHAKYIIGNAIRKIRRNKKEK